MGLLSSLFGKKPPSKVDVVRDEVYLSSKGKFAMVAQRLQELFQADSTSIVLVAHWDETLAELQQIVTDSGVECIAVKSSDLSPNMAQSLPFGEDETIDLVIGERHLIKAGDQRVVDFAEALPCRSRVVHLLSLEDRIMAVFAGDYVRDMMRNLGMKDDECIQSSLVERRIAHAQKKIEQNIQQRARGRTALQWIDEQFATGNHDFDPFV